MLKPIIKRLEFMVINNATATIICTEERINRLKEVSPKSYCDSQYAYGN